MYVMYEKATLVCFIYMQPQKLKIKSVQINMKQVSYMGYFASLLHPQEEKLIYYFQLGTCFGAIKTHVLLSFLWSIFCKWPVINLENSNKIIQD